ncbi:unnamed protein product [Polarella glacialis]|uniref:CCHC-type domain-containing protein n=1 Tax=Polarella glacialis TaxID=89957 RepID=A0A813J2V7_POLGL|nr:unnamed protein product [Polarella glacialis]
MASYAGSDDWEHVGPSAAAAPAQTVSAVPTPNLADLGKLLDLRCLLQPPQLGPTDNEFAEWKFQLENVLTPLSIEHYMSGSVAMERDPTMAEMNEAERMLARFLYTVLVATTPKAKKAAVLLRGIHDKNGFAGWRRLCRMFQPDVTTRHTAVFAGLLRPRWTAREPFEPQLMQWGNEVDLYELESGDSMSDKTRVAVVLQYAPPEIKDFIRRCTTDVTMDYATLRAAICGYIHKGESYGPTGIAQPAGQAPVPMEVGALRYSPRRWGDQRPAWRSDRRCDETRQQTTTTGGMWRRQWPQTRGYQASSSSDAWSPGARPPSRPTAPWAERAAGAQTSTTWQRGQDVMSKGQPGGHYGKGVGKAGTKGEQKGKGKGKGKGKDKGKNVAETRDFAGECYNCGGYGHRAADCLHVITEQDDDLHWALQQEYDAQLAEESRWCQEEAELQEEQQPAAMEQQEEETVPLEQPAEAESADDMQDIRVPKRPAEREESPPRLRLRTPDLAETAGDTLHTVQQKYERDVHSEDQGHLFAANFLDTLAALVVADEPELFVGVDPGYDEQWRELPYEAVLQGRRKELTSMRNFKVYEEVSDGDLPAGTKVIPCRFLYKMKKDGAVKARLVVQQVRSTATGLGWAQTFAACPTILGGRVVVWCAEVHRWPIVEGDVSTAFLHAPLPDDDWTVVRPPSCIYVGKLWRLKKALYGLRVAPKIFQSWYVQQQAALNFRRCRSDPQVFWRSRDGAMHLTHADDVRITLPLDKVQTVQDEFKQKMVIRWDRTLGPTWTAYLGSFWRRSSPACVQVAADPRHVKALATMFSISLDSCKPVRTPMWPAQSEKESEPLPPHEARRFRTAVGILQWLALRRPDIQFSSKEVARGLSTPTVRDLARVKKLAKYVVTTKDTVLELETDTSLPRELTLYCDASYAGDEDQRKSTTGFALFLQGVLLLSGSKTQSVVALSTAEAELLAMNSAVKEALFARSLLEEVGCERLPIRVYSDSSAGLAIASRTGLGRLRHVQVQHLWLQDLVQTRDVKLLKIASTNNPADILTKQLPPAKVDFYRNVLCLQIVPDVFKEIQSNP